METPNFKLHSISELRFSAKISIPNEIAQQIKQISPPDKDHDSTFYEKYGTGNSSYIGVSTITEPTKKDQPHRFIVHYHKSNIKLPTRKYAKIGQLVEILSVLSMPVEFGCLLIFSFSKRDKVKTIIELPLVVSKSPNSLLSEVRGLHFAKTDGKKSIYEVIIDHTEDNQLFETVAFNHSVAISGELVNSIIYKAVEISNRFIFREK